MTKFLHIASSPRGDSSKSSALAQAFVKAEQLKNPDAEIDMLNIWDYPLPDFDGDSAAAKMTFFGVGEMYNKAQSAWDEIVQITERFKSADHYVLSVPMWNGGIPYRLKQYIDIITQPGLLFGFAPETGYQGLLKNKKATVFYTSGVWALGTAAQFGTDFHSSYLGWWLDFIGVNDTQSIRFQPTLLTADPEKDFAEALSKAQGIAVKAA